MRCGIREALIFITMGDRCKSGGIRRLKGMNCVPERGQAAMKLNRVTRKPSIHENIRFSHCLDCTEDCGRQWRSVATISKPNGRQTEEGQALST